MLKSATAAIALILALILPEPVWGQSVPCMARDEMLGTLERDYGEVPVAYGTAGDRLVEMTASPDGRTWSLIVTWPEGGSCIFAAGQDWEVFPVKRGRGS